ncbi:serine/threonine-protein kinase [Candidatus Uabimicrobium amorphum]|uniref:Serine/threonine protein kinase n=1 Tax=Uabimicrobium amorphum TaxID=2596890 RepID=A0A5S9IQP2_UABAM|nr:serine/threonine-protein kinase [Candidatus Uabimicrobium amorphum]BBM86333.1 serine/threonine protein kinase [Candidatus Uabimicrobium amorphum]
MDDVKFKTLWEKLLNNSEDIRYTYKPSETFSDKNTIVPQDATDTFSSKDTISPENSKETFSDNKTITSSENPEKEKAYTKTKIEVPLDTKQDYTDLKEINRGGMGIIYQARQKKLKRDIAIKKMLSDKGKEKFLAESLVNAYLEHPNIVPVHEIDTNDEGEILLAMKFVQGISWKDLLYPKTKEQQDRSAEYNLEGHLGILLNVCNAIAYSHHKNIIHCDLKPENVMIGEFGEVLVMDWGIAVDLGSREDEVKETRTFKNTEINHPMGTPCYISPELAEGRGKDISYATDVYLLGGILYEIIYKRPPHQGNTIWKVLLSAREGNMPPFDESVPYELRSVCKRALQGNMGQRYQKVQEFQKAIQDYLAHRQSIIISDKAKKILTEGENLFEIQEKLKEINFSVLYNKLLQAIAGFDQSLELWQENVEAQQGRDQARIEFAKVAFLNNDFGLAKAQLEETTSSIEVTELFNRIEFARLQHENISKKWKFYFRLAIIIIIAFLLVIIRLSTTYKF